MLDRPTRSVSSLKESPPAFGALDRAMRMSRGGLYGLLAWQAGRLFLRLCFSGCAALLVGQLIIGREVESWVLVAVPALLLLATLAGLVADRVQASAETIVSTTLREAAGRRLADMPARQLQSLSAGSLIVGMQRHPEAVAALVVGHRAATIMMAVGPLSAAAVLVPVSWQATLLLVGLTPLMIVFFALVGNAIRRLADAQEQAFGRLAGQFADRVRTLPTILANHALATEEDKLAERLQAHAASTMGVLRTAFLNAGIIDFFASLSIAMLAVFLGLGHLKLATVPGFANLELWQSLFILMIAPDYFAPFRRFSEQYHAKAEGLAAAAALDRLVDGAVPEMPNLPALEGIVGMPMPAQGLIAIVGPSGSGKSTLLRLIAGVDPANGLRFEPDAPAEFTWISTDSYVPEGTLGDAIAWNVGGASPESVLLAAGSVGLLDDGLLPGGLAARIDKGGANLSGGQRLRIAVARAVLTGRAVIADEPTAKLDPATATSIRRVLLKISRSRLVVVATHDGELAALADRAIILAENGRLEVAA